MGAIVELVFEALIEGFCTAFCELSQNFIPEKKISQRAYKIMKIVLCIIAVLLFIGFEVGVILLIYYKAKSAAGWILVGAGLLWLIAGTAIYIRNEKKNAS